MGTAIRLFVVGLFYLSNVMLHAQDEVASDSSSSEPLISISGSASLTSDFYNYSASPTGSQNGRRPAALHRLVLAPTINIGTWLSLPLNLMITYPETNTTTPIIQTPSFVEYFTNPANALGLSSFSPKIGWAQFHLGSHTPKMSELSGGDLQIFGGGIDLRPGGFQFATSTGISQRAVEPNASKNVSGAYKRNMTVGRIAFGNPDSGAVGFNVLYTKDDVTSVKNSIVSILPARPSEDDPALILPADTLRMRAVEGAIASIDLKFQLAPGVVLSAEGAASAFTRDLSSPLLIIDNNPLSSLFTTRTSTRVDGAGTGSLAFRYSTWGVTFSGLYMGAGFEPLGYPFVQSDRIDLKVSPMLNLFDGGFMLSGTIGKRVNNVSETRGELLTQMIANGQVSIQIADGVSISSSYSNFGLRNNRQNALDSARVQNVSESYSIDPNVTFTAADITHTIMASIGVDRFDDYNIVSGVQSSNNTKSATLTYNGLVQTTPLNYGATGSYLENALSSGTLIVRSFGVNASYRLFSGSLTPNLSFIISGSSLGPNPPDLQSFLKGGVRWRISKALSCMGSYAVNSCEYGNPSSKSKSFMEQMIQLSISTTF